MPHASIEESLRLAPLFGKLADRIARDPQWLMNTLKM